MPKKPNVDLRRLLELKDVASTRFRVPVAMPIEILNAEEISLIKLPQYLTIDIQIPIVNIAEFQNMLDYMILKKLEEDR